MHKTFKELNLELKYMDFFKYLNVQINNGIMP